MLIEDFPCPEKCGIETLPWRCWVEFFKATQSKSKINS